MASAYGTLATEGIHRDPVCITKVVDRDDKTIFVAKTTRHARDQGIGRQGRDRHHEGRHHGRHGHPSTTSDDPPPARPAPASSTATSGSSGFTPQLVTAVWVGYPKERTIYVNGARAFGGTVCAPIWASYMRKALAGLPALDFPRQPRPAYNPSKFHIPISRPPSVNGPELGECKQEARWLRIHRRVRRGRTSQRARSSASHSRTARSCSSSPRARIPRSSRRPRPPPSVEPTGGGGSGEHQWHALGLPDPAADEQTGHPMGGSSSSSAGRIRIATSASPEPCRTRSTRRRRPAPRCDRARGSCRARRWRCGRR